MEIERKFLVRVMPDLSGLAAIPYERYYLKVTPSFEDRIQRVGDRYEREKKKGVSNLERTSEKQEMSKEEFESLMVIASGGIVRDSYLVSEDPEITIKVYHGKYEGLVRAELEFDSVDEAKNYQPEDWMGREVTNSSLGRDSQLLGLSEEEFNDLLDGRQN